MNDLMETPAGTERVGDEFHDPDNWVECPDCGYDNPVGYDDCTFCGAEI